MRLLSVLAVLCLLSTGAAAQTAGCARCEASLNLDEQGWNCLVSRLDELEQSRTPILIFTLADAVCRTRGSGVNISAGAPSAGVNISPGDAPTSRVFLLTRDQVACLRLRLSDVRREGDVYHFNFAEKCRAPDPAMVTPAGSSAKAQ